MSSAHCPQPRGIRGELVEGGAFALGGGDVDHRECGPRGGNYPASILGGGYVDENQVDLIIEEAICAREIWGKIRGLLRVALARGTKHEYREGCLAVLALVDEISPTGAGYQVIREIFAPGSGEAGKRL